MGVVVCLEALQPDAEDTEGGEVFSYYPHLDHYPDCLQTTGNNNGTWDVH